MTSVPPLAPPQPVTPNERLRVLGEGRLLQIQPTQVSDSGRYLCVASNVAGEDDQDFTVLIQGVWGPTAGPGAVRGGVCFGGPVPAACPPWPLSGTSSLQTPGRALPLTDLCPGDVTALLQALVAFVSSG